MSARFGRPTLAPGLWLRLALACAMALALTAALINLPIKEARLTPRPIATA